MMQPGITVFLHMLQICGLLFDYYCRKIIIKMEIKSYPIKKISYQHYHFFFHPATCGQPDIQPNALLIYKKGIIRGKIFLEDSNVIFVYSSNNGKAYFRSFCQNGNWTAPIPIKGINNRLFNYHSIQAKICEVSDNHIKIIV